MATTKKATTKKATSKRKAINPTTLRKDIARITKLRYALYKKYLDRWQNSYGKDKFYSAVKHLREAESELSDMY